MVEKASAQMESVATKVNKEKINDIPLRGDNNNDFIDVSSLIKSAQDCYGENQYERAIQYSHQILDIKPNSIEALTILSYAYYHQNKEEEAIEFCTKWIAVAIQNPTLPLALLTNIYRKKAEREAEAKLEERKKIISEISHSIKNLISTVIDPLENLKAKSNENIRIIENALRGANLVRQIVNAMNLSYKGSIDDFYYDAHHYTEGDASDLKTILTESLKYSIGNMFDGKYFSGFMRKYFPSKESYLEATTIWKDVSQSQQLERMIPFLRQYFFDVDITLGSAESFVIGNAKGSAIKLLILFQELTLNAVKYAAFVPKEKRFLKIHFFSSDTQVVFKVENPFDASVKTKTTGLGHIFIENFAKLLETQLTQTDREGVFSVSIAFTNLWKRHGE